MTTGESVTTDGEAELFLVAALYIMSALLLLQGKENLPRRKVKPITRTDEPNARES